MREYRSHGGSGLDPERRRSGRSDCLSGKDVTRTPPPPQCSIALWRGYVSAQFYAPTENGKGALGVSPVFRTWRFPWQKRLPLSKDPTAVAALEALSVDLKARGWDRIRRAPGSDWYEYRFRLSRKHAEPAARGHLALLETSIEDAGARQS